MTLVTKMNPDVRDRWADALESGAYRQGRGKLAVEQAGAVKFCCLGVLCDLAAQAGVVNVETSKEPLYVDGSGTPFVYRYYDGLPNYLPPSVVRWAGLNSYNPRVEYGGNKLTPLGHLNDTSQLSFVDVARLIREQL